ncbi:MAG: cupin domain-containing protein [Candidatus Eremiobacteraeota bacterium]|nr:cupin domain-containing protein [Candidatus Eremiobacteraeota bacterium]
MPIAAAAVAFTLGMFTHSILPSQADTETLKPGIFHVPDLFQGSLPQVMPGVNVKTLAEAETADVGIVEISSVAAHTHNGSNEFVYVVSGTGTGAINGKPATLEPGDLIVLPKGTPHWLKATTGTIKLLAFESPPLAKDDMHFTK